MLLGALLGRLFGALLDTLQLQVRLSDCLARICSGGGEKEGVLLNAFKSGQASKIHQTMPIKWIKKKRVRRTQSPKVMPDPDLFQHPFNTRTVCPCRAPLRPGSRRRWAWHIRGSTHSSAALPCWAASLRCSAPSGRPSGGHPVNGQF